MVDIDRLQAEIEAWKRYEWRGDFERTNYTLTMALEAADELRTLRALRDKVEAADTWYRVDSPDGHVVNVLRNKAIATAMAISEYNDSSRCAAVKLVTAGDTP